MHSESCSFSCCACASLNVNAADDDSAAAGWLVLPVQLVEDNSEILYSRQTLLIYPIRHSAAAAIGTGTPKWVCVGEIF